MVFAVLRFVGDAISLLRELPWRSCEKGGVDWDESETHLCLSFDHQSDELTTGASRIHFDLDCHSPRTAPVGSRMKLKPTHVDYFRDVLHPTVGVLAEPRPKR
jgi:hypothetical protein